jgi:DNA polymerase
MEIHFDGSFEGWQQQARVLLHRHLPPDEVEWIEAGTQPTLFGEETKLGGDAKQSRVRVPKRFLELARTVAAFRDAKKWRLLYSALWRIGHENHDLLKVETDDEVIQLLRMEDAVNRDVHRVHAFVRFSKLTDESGERFVAWYKPDHKSVKLAAPFFAKRFAAMRWSILTPDASAHWNGSELIFSDGVETPPDSGKDGWEDLWCKYYATTFNPARTNLSMMRSEMPVRFWKHMPETENLPSLLTQAPKRVESMMSSGDQAAGAGQFMPENADLDQLRAAIQTCHGCDLYAHATQAVFGEGPASARIVFIGEQPGDKEDRAGRPFVGPAGEVFDRALREANIPRQEVYVTNAVKHFSFEERGTHRIHKTPRLSEVAACRPWMEAELARIGPEMLVCLGATAAKTVFGPQFRLTESRGRFLASRFSERTLVTYHPSAVLRAEGEKSKNDLYRLLVEDLKLVRASLKTNRRNPVSDSFSASAPPGPA